MWLDWLVFCDCGFHSVCPLMEKDKRLMEASWWERLTEGGTGSCSDWWVNPIFCRWVELCSLPAIYLGPNYGGGNEDNGDLPQKIPGMHCYTQCPQPSRVIILSQLKLLFRAKRMCSVCVYEDLKNRQSWSMLRGQDTLYLAKSNT